MNNRRWLGVGLVLLSALGYAFLPIMIKTIYRETDLRPADLLIIRFVLAVAVMWMLVAARRELHVVREMPRRRLWRIVLPGGLFSLAALCAFVALEEVPASTFTVLLYMYPAMVALIMLFLGERLAMLRWVAIGLALAGCVLVVGGKIEGGSLFGIFLVLLNGFMYAIYLILASRIAALVPSFVFGALSMSGTLLFLLPMPFFQGLHLPDSALGWGLSLALVFVSTLLPIMTIFLAMRYIGPTNAAIISTFEPVITLVLAAVLLGESSSIIQYAGGGLIILSVVLLQIPVRVMETTVEAHAA